MSSFSKCRDSVWCLIFSLSDLWSHHYLHIVTTSWCSDSDHIVVIIPTVTQVRVRSADSCCPGPTSPPSGQHCVVVVVSYMGQWLYCRSQDMREECIWWVSILEAVSLFSTCWLEWPLANLIIENRSTTCLEVSSTWNTPHYEFKLKENFELNRPFFKTCSWGLLKF